MQQGIRQLSRSKVRIGHGPLACERLLLADLDEDASESDQERLVRPTVIVVPSRSLRLHLLDRITAQQGGASVGIQCLTLYGLAAQIASREAPFAPPPADILPILVRRFAADESSLRFCLGHLNDSYSSVIGPVEDLLDAGFDAALAEALDEVLQEEGSERASHAEVARARALVRIASRCLDTLAEEGIRRTPSLLQQATELLRTDARSLHAGKVMIYGFADATGVATDFIQALLESTAGSIYLDQPPDPASPDQLDEGIDFGRRFAERIFLAAGAPETDSTPAPRGSIQMFRALGGQAEIRQVAHRIRRLLDGGARPEGIGVVARQLDAYTSLVRTHFWRLGIPFSAIGGTGPRTGPGMRMGAVLDLLKQGRRVAVERWLDSSMGWPEPSSFDLRLAFYGFGAGRLEEAADLDTNSATGDLPLPVHGGIDDSEMAEERPGRGPMRRRIPRLEVERAREQARRICARLDAWQKVELLQGHVEQLRGLLLDDLGWPADGELTVAATRVVDRLGEQTRTDLPLSFEEMVRWLEMAWSEIGRDPLGGQGGGVQVLDVTEARGRTFAHLFVLGLNRGVFPRTVREDPLLPDSLRRVLSREGYGVLPDLPRKLAGFAEERFLFAQLLASSCSTTLSWQEVDDETNPLNVSPLVERLRWSETAESQGQWREPDLALPLFALAPGPELDTGGAPSLAYEHAVRAAVSETRRELGAFLSAAIEESTQAPMNWTSAVGYGIASPVTSADRWAASRIRILEEMDPIRGDRDGEGTLGRLGPFFGFVGPLLDDGDLRFGKRLYVTTLENLAACPWQTFLERLLRLESLPDPLEILPGISPVLVGDLVHSCLERLVASQLPIRASDLEEARKLPAHTVRWPPEAGLDRLLEGQAELVARRHGIGLRGFPRMLARVARPYLDAAGELEWTSEEGLPVVAAEVEGSLSVQLDDSIQLLYFKADRLDVDDQGEHLVDYKTGKNDITSATGAASQHGNLIKRIRAGKALQAITYATAASTDTSTGAYLFLKPDLDGPESARAIRIERRDEEGRTAFHRATSTLITAWRQGSFFPRLVEADRDKAPSRCSFCEVAEACLRHDSGARRRLRTWMTERLDRYVEGFDRSRGAEQASLGVWLLDSKRLAELDGTDTSEGRSS